MIPTLSEAIQLVQKVNKERGSDAGLYIELKHPFYFERHRLKFDNVLVSELRASGLQLSNNADKVMIDCFETPAQLKRLKYMCVIESFDSREQGYGTFTELRIRETLASGSMLIDLDLFSRRYRFLKSTQYALPRDVTGAASQVAVVLGLLKALWDAKPSFVHVCEVCHGDLGAQNGGILIEVEGFFEILLGADARVVHRRQIDETIGMAKFCTDSPILHRLLHIHFLSQQSMIQNVSHMEACMHVG